MSSGSNGNLGGCGEQSGHDGSTSNSGSQPQQQERAQSPSSRQEIHVTEFAAEGSNGSGSAPLQHQKQQQLAPSRVDSEQALQAGVVPTTSIAGPLTSSSGAPDRPTGHDTIPVFGTGYDSLGGSLGRCNGLLRTIGPSCSSVHCNASPLHSGYRHLSPTVSHALPQTMSIAAISAGTSIAAATGGNTTMHQHTEASSQPSPRTGSFATGGGGGPEDVEADPLHQAVLQFCRHRGPGQQPLIRVAHGVYLYAGRKLVLVLRNGRPMVRVSAGVVHLTDAALSAIMLGSSSATVPGLMPQICGTVGAGSGVGGPAAISGPINTIAAIGSTSNGTTFGAMAPSTAVTTQAAVTVAAPRAWFLRAFSPSPGPSTRK